MSQLIVACSFVFCADAQIDTDARIFPHPAFFQPFQTDMIEGTSSTSSSSDSSEDEAEGLTLAQLSRKSPMVPHPRKLNEDTHEDESDEALSSSSDNEQEKESKEDELQVPRALEEVLTEEVVPSKLKDVWKGGED